MHRTRLMKLAPFVVSEQFVKKPSLPVLWRAQGRWMKRCRQLMSADWDAELHAQGLERADVQAPINETWRPTKLGEDGRRQGDNSPLSSSKPGVATQGGLEMTAVAGGSSATAAAAPGWAGAAHEGERRHEQGQTVKMEKKTAKGEEKAGKGDRHVHAAVIEKCYMPPAVDARKTMWETLRPAAIIGKGNGMAKVGYWEVFVGRDWSFSRKDYEDMMVHTMRKFLHPLLYLYIHPPPMSRAGTCPCRA